MAGTMLNAKQLASLSPTAQQQYLQQVAASQELQNAINQQTAIQAQQDFMRNSYKYWVACPVQGGSFSGTYGANNVLVFEMPTVPNGFAAAIKVHTDVTFTPASGSSATYAKTKSAPYSLFAELMVSLGSAQIKTHPYVSKLLAQARRVYGEFYGGVLAGNDNSGIDKQVFNSLPLVAGSAGEWVFDTYWPLNAIAEDDPRGLLPLDGVGNQPLITLTCAPAIYGVDPLQNAVVTGGSGSGQSIGTISGTVKVEVLVLDGKSMMDTVTRKLVIDNLSTIQATKEPEFLNVVGGALQRPKINSLLKHWYMFVVAIDGQASNIFATGTNSGDDNFSIIELSKDATGNNNFFKYGSDSNLTVFDFWGALRYRFGQDWDDGVVPFVLGPQHGINDPSNRSGMGYLNMMDGGYPAATYALQLTTVSTSISGLNPRYVGYLISENPAGLRRTP